MEEYQPGDVAPASRPYVALNVAMTASTAPAKDELLTAAQRFEALGEQ